MNYYLDVLKKYAVFTGRHSGTDTDVRRVKTVTRFRNENVSC